MRFISLFSYSLNPRAPIETPAKHGRRYLSVGRNTSAANDSYIQADATTGIYIIVAAYQFDNC